MIPVAETNSHFVFQRMRKKRSSMHTSFSSDVFCGARANFAEPRSEAESRQYHLTRMEFSKSVWDWPAVEAFWRFFQVLYVAADKRGRKLPPIYRVVGTPDRLIRGGYVVVCEQQEADRTTFLGQASYIYWLGRFGLELPPRAGITDVPRETIAHLLNRIAVNRTIIDHIPRTQAWGGWRLVEQLAAELFDRKGYEVSLTAPSRDGGWDVVAYKEGKHGVLEAMLIECKHWEAPVGLAVVDRLAGVAGRFGKNPPARLMLITTSSFTSDAVAATYNRPFIQPELVNRGALLQLISEWNAVEFGQTELAAYLRDRTERAHRG